MYITHFCLEGNITKTTYYNHNKFVGDKRLIVTICLAYHSNNMLSLWKSYLRLFEIQTNCVLFLELKPSREE